jgi:cell division protein FtsL
MGAVSKEWAISMACSIVLLLVFGLGLVWLNIERVDLAYELNKLQRKIDEGETLTAKLEVERNTLITPARLREVARDYGLGPARPGQIRRVNASGEIESSPLLAASEENKAKTPAKPAVKAAAKAPADQPAAAKSKTRKTGRKL